MNLAQVLFAPRTVALVGASSDAAKNTARPQRMLRRYGFAGRVLPINPGRREVLGEPAYASLLEAPGEIDQAFIMVGAEQVEAAIEQCGARGVPVATVYSDGFGEAGETGRALELRVAARARERGVRLLGPNCIGLVNTANGATLTVNSILELGLPKRGGISVVSQSGSMIGALMSRGAARGVGFAKLVSVGNEADIGVGELAGLLVDDPDTHAVLLFLETLRDADRLAHAARRAHAAGKPVIAYKLGRSALGESLARSHTGALAGSDAAVDAFFRRNGIVRVDMLETLLEIEPLLRGRAPLPPASRPRRVAVTTTTGGGAATVVDRLGTLGVEALVPDEALIAELRPLGIPAKAAPVIDLTLAVRGEQYRAVLDALVAHPGCDAVLAVAGSSALSNPALAVERMVEFAGRGKPVVGFMAPAADQALALLAEAGMAAFRTPEACADALAAYLAWRAPAPPAPPADRPWPADLPPRGTLDEDESLRLFATLGVPTVARAVAHAPSFDHPVPYPVVAKVLSRDILHKTEVGGVALALHDAASFEAGVAAMMARVRAAAPEARLAGVLVQSMVGDGLAEVIVGYRDDELVGPVVMVGMGGRLAELHRDTALRCAPVDEDEAMAMIGEVKGLAVVRGWRGLPRGDVAALARAVAAMSRLALLAGRPVREAEINPLVVRADGVLAVDGVVVTAKD